METLFTDPHKPRTPGPYLLNVLKEKYTVDVEKGKVYGPEGGEVGYAIQMRRGTGWIFVGIYYFEPGSRRKFRHLRRAHVIWWAATGEWPTQQLDHVDRNRANDAIDNLKPSTSLENYWNSEKRHG